MFYFELYFFLKTAFSTLHTEMQAKNEIQIWLSKLIGIIPITPWNFQLKQKDNKTHSVWTNYAFKMHFFHI